MFHVWMLFCLWWPALFCISFYTSLAAAIAHFIYLFTIISSSLQTLTTLSLAFKAAATAARSQEKERNTSSLHNQPSAQKQQWFSWCVFAVRTRDRVRDAYCTCNQVTSLELPHRKCPGRAPMCVSELRRTLPCALTFVHSTFAHLNCEMISNIRVHIQRLRWFCWFCLRRTRTQNHASRSEIIKFHNMKVHSGCY